MQAGGRREGRTCQDSPCVGREAHDANAPAVDPTTGFLGAQKLTQHLYDSVFMSTEAGTGATGRRNEREREAEACGMAPENDGSKPVGKGNGARKRPSTSHRTSAYAGAPGTAVWEEEEVSHENTAQEIGDHFLAGDSGMLSAGLTDVPDLFALEEATPRSVESPPHLAGRRADDPWTEQMEKDSIHGTCAAARTPSIGKTRPERVSEQGIVLEWEIPPTRIVSSPSTVMTRRTPWSPTPALCRERRITRWVQQGQRVTREPKTSAGLTDTSAEGLAEPGASEDLYKPRVERNTMPSAGTTGASTEGTMKLEVVGHFEAPYDFKKSLARFLQCV